MDVVASSITFVSTVISACKAINSLSQCPREFAEVEQRLPLVQNTLHCIRDQLQGELIDDSLDIRIRDSLSRCDGFGRQLKDVFDGIQAYNTREGSTLVRYRKTLVSKGKQLGKAHRVESLMKGMLACVKDLAENHIFRLATQTQVAQLAKAFDELSHTMSSVTDADFERASQPTSQNIASGGTGNQSIQNIGGAFHNNGVNTINGNSGTINFVTQDTVEERERRKKEDELRPKVMRSLAPLPYLEAKNQNKQQLEGTCVWFTEHEKFQQWSSTSTSSFLYVSADPGCGKSVLSRYLVDAILPRSNDRILCYFFFKEDIALQASAVNALQCILHQIFTARPSLLTSDILNTFDHSNHTITSIDSLWDILLRISKDAHCGEVVCLVDALDECPEREFRAFSRCVSSFYANPPSDSRLKFLCTSRPYEHIKRSILPGALKTGQCESEDVSVICLKGETEEEVNKIAKEIDIVIDAEVDIIGTDRGWSNEEVDCVRSQLRKAPNRTYLWAHLTLDWLKNELLGLRRSIFESLSTRIPHTVDDAYEKILSRSKHPPKKILKLLHIMVAATRALTLDEMGVALSIGPEHKSIKDVEPLEGGTESHIRELCGLFVSIVDSKVYFLHQTAKEFLLQGSTPVLLQGSTPVISETSWRNTLREEDSHKTMFRICSWVLLAMESLPREPGLYGQQLRDFYSEKCAFSVYSYEQLNSYYELFLEEGFSILAALLNVDEGGHYKDPYKEPTWYRLSKYDGISCRFGAGTPLFISLHCGWVSFTRHLLQSARHIKELETPNDPKVRDPLLYVAAHVGSVDIIRALFSHVDDKRRLELVNEYNIGGNSPLTQAGFKSHIDCMKLLVEAGADTDSADYLGNTPLYYACLEEDTELCKLLLGKGARFLTDDVVIYYEGCLFAKQDFLIQLLGEERISQEFSPFYYDIYTCQRNEAGSILRLCDINTVDKGGFTPLTRALTEESYCDTETAVEFIDRGANVLLPDGHGRKPLWYCSIIGHRPVIRRILSKAQIPPDAESFLGLLTTQHKSQLSSADRGQVNKVIATLIAYACQDDDIELVRYLYQEDLREFRADGFWTAHLIAALARRSENVITFLIDHYDNTSDYLFGGIKLALHIALSTGCEMAISVLLPKLEALDHQSYSTYLSTMAFPAVFTGNWISRMGTDIPWFRCIFSDAYETEMDLEDDTSEYETEMDLEEDTPPIETLIDLLQRHGANINARDGHGRTALFHAESLDVVAALVKKGADVEAEDADGTTPLLFQIGKSEPAIAVELISNGADVSRMNSRGETALALAVQKDWLAEKAVSHVEGNGHIETSRYSAVVRILLSRGASAENIVLSDHNSAHVMFLIQGCLYQPGSSSRRGWLSVVLP